MKESPAPLIIREAPGCLVLLVLLALIVAFLAAFGEAAEPTSPDLPRWQRGKPQQIEASLFP